MPSKSFKMFPSLSVMMQFSAVKPSTALMIRRCTPKIFLRLERRSLMGLGFMMTLAVTGFWSEVKSLSSGRTNVTSAKATSSSASMCCFSVRVMACCNFTFWSASVVDQPRSKNDANGSTLAGTRPSVISMSRIFVAVFSSGTEI